MKKVFDFVSCFHWGRLKGECQPGETVRGEMKMERGRAVLLLGIQGKRSYRAPGEKPCSFPLCLNINFALCLAFWSDVS